jgi:hypothetical protein
MQALKNDKLTFAVQDLGTAGMRSAVEAVAFMLVSLSER